MATQEQINGNQRPWDSDCFGVLVYLVKSGMLTPTVDLHR
jgi:hypothetical protein